MYAPLLITTPSLFFERDFEQTPTPVDSTNSTREHAKFDPHSNTSANKFDGPIPPDPLSQGVAVASGDRVTIATAVLAVVRRV